MKDLKDRFVQAWLYGSRIFKAVVALFVISFAITVSWTDLSSIYICWIGSIVYLATGIFIITYMYYDSI